MDTKLLKQKILDLAIHGKLVPQDPNDEPASVLLERIRAEREQQNPQGRRRQSQNTSDNQHYTNVPFEIPSSWKWVRVEDYVFKVTDFVASGSFASLRENVKYFTEENYAIIVRTVDLGCKFRQKLTYTDKHGYNFLSNSNLHGGELILSNIGSIGKVFIVPHMDKPMTLGPNSIMLKTQSSLATKYLYFLFASLWGWNVLHAISSSTAQGKFNKTDLKEVLLPIPPLAEQQRIVAEIERLFAVIDNLEESKQDLQAAIKQTRAKVLDLAIHGKLVPQDPTDEPASELLKRINPHYTPCDTSHYENALFEIPQSWAWVKIDDVLTLMNGYAFKSSQYISDDGVRIIRITNVQDGYVCDDDPKFYPNSLLDEYTPFLLKEGDLLMSLTGNVGRVGLLPKEMLPAALNQRVACFREKQSLGYLRYIFYLMRSTFFIEACVASGNATAQLNISTNWLKSFRIPLPPLAEQQRIIAKIESIFEILDSIEDSIC